MRSYETQDIDSSAAHASPRTIAAALLCLLATSILSVFYGSPENAVLLLSAVFALMLAASLIGPERLADGMIAEPLASAVPVAALLVLAAVYQGSLSKDGSFAPSWSLALLPLSFLIVRELGPWRWRLHAAFSGLVLVFACLSLWKLLMHGERPMLPLVDPNNYCTLLYLALFPWAYRYLHRCWERRSFNGFQHAAVYVAAAIMVSTVFATQSRTSAIIVGAGMTMFLLLAISRRNSLKPVVGLCVVTLVAYIGVVELHFGSSRFNTAEIHEGIGIRGALNGAALRMYGEHPLTGAGVNVFPLYYRMLRDPADQSTAGISVHNDYLQFLAEGGPLLLGVLLAFAISVVLRYSRMLLDRSHTPDWSFGVLMALGAALAHAIVNFVLLTTVLACFVGISAGLVRWQTHRSEVGASRALRRGSRGVIGAALIWGWLCFGYLALDTFSLGVYERQPGIPFASQIRDDPQKLLSYSRFAQAINGNRGVPIFAEAVLRQMELAAHPDSEYLHDQVLHAFRRALSVDAWNPNLLLQMHRFVTEFPAVQPKLGANEQPENLLLRAVTLDPIFLPGYQQIIATFESQGRPELGYRFVRERLGPWLVWLQHQDAQAAASYFDYLHDWAEREQDEAYLAELTETAVAMARVVPAAPRMWFR